MHNDAGAGGPAQDGGPEVSVEEFVALVKQDVKKLSSDDLATLINFLTAAHHPKHWQCISGKLGFVVNVPGGGAFPDTSYTIRLVDSRDDPALAVHQYGGLNAPPHQTRGYCLVSPSARNEAVFAAFGRFLATTAMLDDRPNRGQTH